MPLAFLLALVGDCRAINFSWLRELFLKERLGVVQSVFASPSWGGEHIQHEHIKHRLQLALHCNTPAETRDNNVPVEVLHLRLWVDHLGMNSAVTGFRDFPVLRAPHYLGLSFTSPAIRRTLLWNTFRLCTVKIRKDDKLCCIQTEGKQHCSHNGKTAIEHFRKLECYEYIEGLYSFPTMEVEVRGRREGVSVSEALPML